MALIWELTLRGYVRNETCWYLAAAADLTLSGRVARSMTGNVNNAIARLYT